jgi:hypothetical protein
MKKKDKFVMVVPTHKNGNTAPAIGTNVLMPEHGNLKDADAKTAIAEAKSKSRLSSDSNWSFRIK